MNFIIAFVDFIVHYEQLQDKLSQLRDARAALDALRDEHKDRLRQQAEEQERARQSLMAQKLHIMRQKKQEYLQYQRQIALQRMQEQEREMQLRIEQQKQTGFATAQVPGQPQYQHPSYMNPPHPGTWKCFNLVDLLYFLARLIVFVWILLRLYGPSWSSAGDCTYIHVWSSSAGATA